MTSTVTTRPAGSPPRRRWTRFELRHAIDSGVFRPEERLELIDGEIVEKMTQISPHATGISACEEALRAVLPPGFYLRVQLPLAASEYSQPDPDLAVISGTFRDYEDDHPTTAALVIEVSDTTLAYDRTVKARIYAGAAVEEYWILNLNERVLEVYTQPKGDSGGLGARRYPNIERLTESQTVTPGFSPGSAIPVSNLLPGVKRPS
jgi:Uma2 family endonuclease